MADGSVKIDVGLNLSKAERDLAKLRDKINKTEDQLNANAARKTELEKQIEQIGFQADKAKEKVRELKQRLGETRSRDEKATIREQLAEATEEQRLMQQQLNQADSEYIKINKSIEQGTADLQEMKEQAGEMSAQIAAARPGEMIAESLKSAKKAMMTFLKYALGIRSLFFLFRRLRTAIKGAVSEFAERDLETKQTIANLKTALEQLKVSWGAAFAPILNAVAPLLQTLIGYLVSAANAVARFIAIISGKSTYMRAVANADAVAAGMDKVSGAAGSAADSIAEAKRQIMGFDEINQLTDDKSSKGGGGAGAGSKFDTVEEAIDAYDGSFLSNLALSFKDVLFDWSDLNPEQIAEKILAGLGAALGLALGISLGLGPGGIILMTLAGLTVGLIFDALIFNHDGKLSKTELTDMILVVVNGMIGGIAGFIFTRTFKGAMIGATIATGLTLAYKAIDMKTDGALSKNGIAGGLTSLLAGVLGLQVGKTIFAGSAIAGPAGAAIGIVVGLVLTLVVESIRAKMAAKDSFYESELGQQVTALKEQIQKSLETSADLTVHINSITGEVDESTLANLGAAQALIDRIFTLDGKENKTSQEIAQINANIETLNGMGLPGVFLTFDEATGHVNGTRDALMQTTEELLKQYQVQAMGEAYVEALKAQFSAQEERTQAIQNGKQAVEDFHAAEQSLADAEAEYQAARESYDVSAGYGDSQARLEEAKAALAAAREGVEAARTNAEEADKAIQASLENIDKAKEKVGTIEESFTDLVSNVGEAGADTAQGWIDKYNETAAGMPTAAEESAQATQDALRDIWEIHSPSKVTQDMAKDVTDGFVQGFNDHTPDVVSAAHSMFDAIYNEISSSVERIKTIMDFQWSLPRPSIPVISASYSTYSYGNGQYVSIPQFFVDWYARGGVFSNPALIGVGEAGKEAVVPLERNTEWMETVAQGLMDRLTKADFANQLAEAFMRAPRPAMASGQIVPPNAVNSGYNSLSDADISRLVSGFMATLAPLLTANSNRPITTTLQVNGREFCRATYYDQQAVANEKGVSLITNG